MELYKTSIFNSSGNGEGLVPGCLRSDSAEPVSAFKIMPGTLAKVQHYLKSAFWRIETVVRQFGGGFTSAYRRPNRSCQSRALAVYKGAGASVNVEAEGKAASPGYSFPKKPLFFCLADKPAQTGYG